MCSEWDCFSEKSDNFKDEFEVQVFRAAFVLPYTNSPKRKRTNIRQYFAENVDILHFLEGRDAVCCVADVSAWMCVMMVSLLGQLACVVDAVACLLPLLLMVSLLFL